MIRLLVIAGMLAVSASAKAFAPGTQFIAASPADSGVIRLTTHEPVQWGCDIWCGGTLTGQGALPVIESGICWSMDTLPTISDNHLICSGSNSFDCIIPYRELGFWNCWQPLYFRAYATNSSGTYYGDVKTYFYQPQFVSVHNEIIQLTPNSVTFRRDIIIQGMLYPDRIIMNSTLYPPGYPVCSNGWWPPECTVDSLQPATDYIIRDEILVDCMPGCIIMVSINDFAFTTPPLAVSISNTGQVPGEFKIYPNPAADWLHLEITTTTNALLEIEILDATGQVRIRKQLGESVPGKSIFRLPVTELEQGLYLFRLELETEKNKSSYLEKVVVKK